MVKRMAAVLGSVLILGAVPCTAIKADAAFSVEQIQAVMPEITLYVNSDTEISADNIKARLDYEPIDIVSVEKFADTAIPINYYFLIDDSGSVSSAQMESIKTVLDSFDNIHRKNDSVTVISVGSLETLFSGKKLDDAYHTEIAGLKNNKQETFLYEALDSVTDTIAVSEDKNASRNIIIAFSDGFNEAVGKTSYNEITQKLKDCGTPLYAMGIKGKDNTNLEAFGELARSTGGDIISFEPEECGKAFDGIINGILESYKINLMNDDNIICGERTLLIEAEPENFRQEYTINPVEWIPDNTAPEMTGFEKISDNQFTVTFSEAVNNADNIKSYEIMCGETALVLKSASYSEDDGKYTARLTASENIYSGEYSVRPINITDVSNERNTVNNTLTKNIEGLERESETPPITVNNDGIGAWLWIIIAVAVVLVGTAVLIIILKRHSGIVTVDGKVMLGDSVRFKHHISGKNKDRIMLGICITGDDGSVNEIEVSVAKQLTVGRAQQNDIYFDDPTMSRYHFIIENNEGKIIIKDNESFSGTFINGMRASVEGYELKSGDMISAGNTKMIIRW